MVTWREKGAAGHVGCHQLCQERDARNTCHSPAGLCLFCLFSRTILGLASTLCGEGVFYPQGHWKLQWCVWRSYSKLNSSVPEICNIFPRSLSESGRAGCNGSRLKPHHLGGWGRWLAMSSRSAWASKWVSGETELLKGILSQSNQTNQPINQQKNPQNFN